MERTLSNSDPANPKRIVEMQRPRCEEMAAVHRLAELHAEDEARKPEDERSWPEAHG